MTQGDTGDTGTVLLTQEIVTEEPSLLYAYHNVSFNGFFIFCLFKEAFSPRAINPQMIPAL